MRTLKILKILLSLLGLILAVVHHDGLGLLLAMIEIGIELIETLALKAQA